MNTKLITAITLALGMAACATVPIENAALENARNAVRTAESDPNVQKYAALDLQSARNELAEADAAAVRRDERSIAQPAYLATQTARLAQLRAGAKANDARVAAGQADRDRIQLNARTQEVNTADSARDDAKQKAASADAARDQADSANRRSASGVGCAQGKADGPRAGADSGGRVIRHFEGGPQPRARREIWTSWCAF